MSLMTLFIIWAVITAVLVILLIYRSTLSMHEDDQLFLDEASSSMRVEQEQLQASHAESLLLWSKSSAPPLAC